MLARTQLALAVAFVFAVLFACERVIVLRPPTRPLLGRLVVNGAISILTFVVAMIWVRPAALAALAWTSERPFGLAHVVPLPSGGQFVVAFLCLDLTFYWWHVANHRIAFLWRFHNVHHVDPDLDVSTAFRFHFGEVALSALFRVLQVAAIGPSASAFAVYELVFQANTLFHHSNVRLPIAVERLLNAIIVTPRMHGIHHSQVRDETNSNYSVVFSWWDRLHRTVRLNIPQSIIVVGVPAYSAREDNALVRDLLLPFRPQREYWAAPEGGALLQRKPEGVAGGTSRLAE